MGTSAFLGGNVKAVPMVLMFLICSKEFCDFHFMFLRLLSKRSFCLKNEKKNKNISKFKQKRINMLEIKKNKTTNKCKNTSATPVLSTIESNSKLVPIATRTCSTKKLLDQFITLPRNT